MSFVAWLSLSRLFPSAHYGFGFFDSVLGLAPLVIRAAIPTAVLAVAGAWLSPSKGRRVAFFFLVLSLLFSAGGIEMLQAQSDSTIWLYSSVGVVLGSFTGWFLALRLLAARAKTPNSERSASP